MRMAKDTKFQRGRMEFPLATYFCPRPTYSPLLRTTSDDVSHQVYDRIDTYEYTKMKRSLAVVALAIAAAMANAGNGLRAQDSL